MFLPEALHTFFKAVHETKFVHKEFLVLLPLSKCKISSTPSQTSKTKIKTFRINFLQFTAIHV